MRTTIIRSGIVSLLLVIGLLFTGCTTVIKPAPRSIQYSTNEKIPLKIALNLTDDLRNAKWEQRAMIGGSTIMAVGPALTDDAPQLARNTFADVQAINNNARPPNPVDAVLTPKMAFIGIEYGQTMFSKDTITIKMEWSLADPTGNMLWADTITGLGSSKGGFSKDLTLAIEDVLKKSQDAMLTSAAIRQAASKKQSNVN